MPPLLLPWLIGVNYFKSDQLGRASTDLLQQCEPWGSGRRHSLRTQKPHGRNWSRWRRPRSRDPSSGSGPGSSNRCTRPIPCCAPRVTAPCGSSPSASSRRSSKRSCPPSAFGPPTRTAHRRGTRCRFLCNGSSQHSRPARPHPRVSAIRGRPVAPLSSHLARPSRQPPSPKEFRLDTLGPPKLGWRRFGVFAVAPAGRPRLVRPPAQKQVLITFPDY